MSTSSYIRNQNFAGSCTYTIHVTASRINIARQVLERCHRQTLLDVLQTLLKAFCILLAWRLLICIKESVMACLFAMSDKL